MSGHKVLGVLATLSISLAVCFLVADRCLGSATSDWIVGKSGTSGQPKGIMR